MCNFTVTIFFSRIEVMNTSGRGVMATVRIFMVPNQNETGQPLSFDEQRKSMIELDKFTTTCKCLIIL